MRILLVVLVFLVQASLASAAFSHYFSQSTPVSLVIVDGPNVTMRSEIIFNTTSGEDFVKVTKPSFINMSNFRVNESGIIVPVMVSGDFLRWNARLYADSFLLFDVPAPKKERSSVIVGTPEFYRKELVVSSLNNFPNISVSFPINPAFGTWQLYELRNTTFADATDRYDLAILNRTAKFSGFSGKFKLFLIEGSEPLFPDRYSRDSSSGSGDAKFSSGSGAGAASSGGSSSVAGGNPNIPSVPSPSNTLPPIVLSVSQQAGKEEEPFIPQYVRAKTDVIISIKAPDFVESGELYSFNVTIMSKASGSREIVFRLGDETRTVKLSPLGEQTLFFQLRAPMEKGKITLVASAEGALDYKVIGIEFRPLVMDAVQTRIDDVEWVILKVALYQFDLTTDILVLRYNDTVYSVKVNDKVFELKLRFEQSGDYVIYGRSYDGPNLLDEDVISIKLGGNNDNKAGDSWLLILAVMTVLITLLLVAAALKMNKIRFKS